MSSAYPYIVSYFTVGLLFTASGLLNGLFSRDRMLFSLLFTVLFWPVLLLIVPESLLRSTNQVAPATRCSSSPTEDLARLVEIEASLLSKNEQKRLTKVARYGDGYISLFGDRSNFEEILNALWNQKIPPAVYYQLNSANRHLDEDFDPTAAASFSRRPPDWYVGFSTEFVKSIAKVDRKKQGRILEAIGKVAAAPMEVHGDTVKPLTGELSGLWRCRLGDDRLIYYPHTDSRKIILISYASRGEVYEDTIDIAALTPQ